MVAYSCKARFAAPIEAGTKLFTMRNHRKRHARQGEIVQLYQGMRTRQCRLIDRKICRAVHNVRLVFGKAPEIRIDGARVEVDLDQFARADGFYSWADLIAFWQAEHSEVFEQRQPRWFGVMILWGEPVWKAVNK